MTIETKKDLLDEQAAEIERLQNAKRRALAIADERSRESVELRAQNAAILDDYRACMVERDRLRAAVKPFAQAITLAESAEPGNYMPDTLLEGCRAHVTLYEFAMARDALQ